MGCCISKLPDFKNASVSLADGILPESAKSLNPNFIPVKIIPNPSLLSAAIAVYMPSDEDLSPSYFFNGSGGSFKLFKMVEMNTGDKGDFSPLEKVVLKAGWQSSKSHGVSGNAAYGGHQSHEITDRAEKTCTVQPKDSTSAVTIKKLYVRGEGQSFSIDSGFEIVPDQSNRCQVVSRHGRIVAYIYEANMPGNGSGMPDPGLMTSFAMSKDYFKRPICLHIEKMSEEDLELTLSVIATANDRLIRTAMLDISGGGIGGGIVGEDDDCDKIKFFLLVGGMV
jgi:hypothetical protein